VVLSRGGNASEIIEEDFAKKMFPAYRLPGAQEYLATNKMLRGKGGIQPARLKDPRVYNIPDFAYRCTISRRAGIQHRRDARIFLPRLPLHFPSSGHQFLQKHDG